jgi:nucleoside-diphosphate-sugar epimerase
MKVLIAGASGVLGRHMAEALLVSGHEVLGLGRSGAGEALVKQGVTSLTGDLMNRVSVLRAVEGQQADVVVHAATALRKIPTKHKDMWATDALRIQGTTHLIEAAGVVGATRFVVESMIFGYGYRDAGNRPLTEDEGEFGKPMRNKQFERHVAAMRSKEQQAFNAPGIEGISLRFGLLYGPGYGTGGTDGLLPVLRARKMPAPNTHGRVLPWVNLLDAGTATVAAIERGRAGQAYNIVDDERITFGDHLRAVAQAFGTPPPRTVPGWLTTPMPLIRAAVKANLVLSNEKAKHDLGWRPRYATTAEGLAAMAHSGLRAAP